MCCYAKMMHCHDSHMTSCILCAQKSARYVPDSFLLLGVISADKTVYFPFHPFQGQLKKRKLECGGEAGGDGGTAKAQQSEEQQNKTGSGGVSSGGSGRRRKKARKEAAEEIAEQSKSMGPWMYDKEDFKTFWP